MVNGVDGGELQREAIRMLGGAQALARAALELMDADDPTAVDMDTASSLLFESRVLADRARLKFVRAREEHSASHEAHSTTAPHTD